ncbi:MAG: prepilin-type N-terminal cleavage/methylation domain-containing protein [Proteobacteria bacterium]|nr:prepilin-type N-terminal cleavage/methylation domain-containing protein [Pseudomonadota bacterium]
MRMRRTDLGFTLIEMMVVVIIVAVMMTGVGLSIGATARAKLRSSCFKLVSAVRYGYSNSVTQGVTTRLVLDFDDRTFYLEETAGRVVLNRDDETGEGFRSEEEELEDRFGDGLSTIGTGLGGRGFDGTADGASDMMNSMTGGILTDPFLAAMQSGTIDGPIGYKRPTFKKIAGRRGEIRELEGNTTFVVAYTPHEPLPREEGKAYIYFFPNGVTEHSIVQVSDGSDRIYSVEVHPLSGRAFIHNEPIEPEGELDELQEAEE